MRRHFYHSYKPTQIQRKGTETIPLIGRSVKELVAIGKKQASHARHSWELSLISSGSKQNSLCYNMSLYLKRPHKLYGGGGVRELKLGWGKRAIKQIWILWKIDDIKGQCSVSLWGEWGKGMRKNQVLGSDGFRPFSWRGKQVGNRTGNLAALILLPSWRGIHCNTLLLQATLLSLCTYQSLFLQHIDIFMWVQSWRYSHCIN